MSVLTPRHEVERCLTVTSLALREHSHPGNSAQAFVCGRVIKAIRGDADHSTADRYDHVTWEAIQSEYLATAPSITVASE